MRPQPAQSGFFIPPSSRPASAPSEGQTRAFYGKLASLHPGTDPEAREAREQGKAGLYALAAEHFGHAVEHSADLSWDEMHWLLDQLEQRVKARHG
jgi:hypothetical protein